jgi:hypothetical protein
MVVERPGFQRKIGGVPHLDIHPHESIALPQPWVALGASERRHAGSLDADDILYLQQVGHAAQEVIRVWAAANILLWSTSGRRSLAAIELLGLGSRLGGELEAEIAACPRGVEMFVRPLSRSVGRFLGPGIDGAQQQVPTRVSRQLMAAYEVAQALLSVAEVELSGELTG